jgi:hypothetical protein
MVKVNSGSWVFKWLGAATVGTFIGLAAGAVVGLLIGGGLGGWFWYDMRNDGFNALSDDTENLFGFCVTVGLGVLGALVGLIGGGLTGLLTSTLISAIIGSSKPSKPHN